jgi:hypothetical protein
VALPFDRARLETADDDPSFPAAEPASISPRPSLAAPGRISDVEHGFFNSLPSFAPGLPSLPAPPLRTASPERLAFAKTLFFALFGALALLLAYALVQRLMT